MTYEEWQKSLDVNLTGPMLCYHYSRTRHQMCAILVPAVHSGLQPSRQRPSSIR
jgi:NAD(P)-dependent dehydrogenase (short-subunit alcohol dehydrogenase family)